MGNRTCFFCGSTDKLTRSHVISKWLIESLPGEHAGSRIIEDRFKRDGIPATREVRETSKNSRENKPKLLCGPCNNVWMESHERQVNALLHDLSLAKTATLTQQQQTDLALWAAIAGMLRGAMSWSKPVPAEDASFIRRNNRLPDGYQVWMLQGSNRDDWPTMFVPAHSGEGETIGWMAWIWIGHLVLVVASRVTVADTALSLGPIGPVVRGIYPNSTSISWPYHAESYLTHEQLHGLTDPRQR